MARNTPYLEVQNANGIAIGVRREISFSWRKMFYYIRAFYYYMDSSTSIFYVKIEGLEGEKCNQFVLHSPLIKTFQVNNMGNLTSCNVKATILNITIQPAVN